MHVPADVAALYMSLAEGDNITYILSSDLRFVEMNAAWDNFAILNGGESSLAHWFRGSSLMDTVPAELKRFYSDAFAQAASTRRRWEHDYECSSATEFRQYRMIVYPFSEWFVVTHALLVEKPHEGVAEEPSDQYESRGLIAMCGHCRRVRSATNPTRWDWVPAYVANPRDNITHGLCTACYRYYYPTDPV